MYHKYFDHAINTILDTKHKINLKLTSKKSYF